MITVKQYFMDRDNEYRMELTDAMRANAETIVHKANLLLNMAINDRVFLSLNSNKSFVRSGWRPKEINARTPGAAVMSKHMTCEAIDIEDIEGDLDEWCMNHQDVLEELGLWMEHPSATKSYCHLQTKPPRSGKRVFYP